MIIGRTLKQTDLTGYTTTEATNGVEALEKIAQDPPDLVLSDWNMPEMKGIDLLKRVRESGNEVLFGFITSESGPETRQLAMDSGASFLVTKPFTAESMQAAIMPAVS